MKLLFQKRKHTKKKKTNERHGTTTNPNASQQPSLTRDERRKLRRLQRNGIIVLIDQRNLEIAVRRSMRKEYSSSWALSYGYLVKVIARGGIMQGERRKVLGAYIVTSKEYQVKQRHRPSKRYLQRNHIEVKRTPDERKRKPKAVSATLVRIMTQEFEGIEMLRLKGMTPPKRTICIVTGNIDYLDVVQQARESGCDVEIWFWTRYAFSKLWYDERDIERRGGFSIKNLRPFREGLSRSWRDNFEAWSESPYESDSSD